MSAVSFRMTPKLRTQLEKIQRAEDSGKITAEKASDIRKKLMDIYGFDFAPSGWNPLALEKEGKLDLSALGGVWRENPDGSFTRVSEEPTDTEVEQMFDNILKPRTVKKQIGGNDFREENAEVFFLCLDEKYRDKTRRLFTPENYKDPIAEAFAFANHIEGLGGKAWIKKRSSKERGMKGITVCNPKGHIVSDQNLVELGWFFEGLGESRGVEITYVPSMKFEIICEDRSSRFMTLDLIGDSPEKTAKNLILDYCAGPGEKNKAILIKWPGGQVTRNEALKDLQPDEDPRLVNLFKRYELGFLTPQKYISLRNQILNELNPPERKKPGPAMKTQRRNGNMRLMKVSNNRKGRIWDNVRKIQKLD